MKRFLLALLITSAACSSDKSEGVQLTVIAAGQTLPTSVQSSGGVTVASTSTYVVLGAVEIASCSSTAAKLWRLVNPLPSAFAHSESSPFHLGTPDVVSLTGERAATTIGALQPPPGDYCSVTIELDAADDDALNVGLEPAIVDKTYVARGTAGANTYDVSTDATDSITLPINKLTLDADHLDATLTIAVDMTHAYDGIDFTSDTLATDLFEKLHNVWSVTVASP